MYNGKKWQIQAKKWPTLTNYSSAPYCSNRTRFFCAGSRVQYAHILQV